MRKKLKVSYHGLQESPAVSELVQKRAQKLERMSDQIIGCEVCIEQPHQRRRHGNHFRVRIDLTVPGRELIVDRDPTERTEDEDLYQAIGLAFDAMERKIRDMLNRRTKATKHSKVALTN